MVHIDYGFILGDSPGFNINFENAPFKLTKEYIDLLGGLDSIPFKMFEDLFVRAFFALQKHLNAICAVVEVCVLSLLLLWLFLLSLL
jgi:phosphatidylinositol 4-kinase B